MHAKGTITNPSTATATAAAPNNRNKKVIFKNCAPFTDCINEINNTQEDNARNALMQWRHGVVVITTVQLHSTKPEPRFCVLCRFKLCLQTLLAACQRFAMVRISDNGLGWKQG